MLVNFALDVIGTSVSCDKVSTDGHESINLIHTDYLSRKKGYIAEYFVKPPVHITFTLPCNVNISHVVMEPYVGQQQSMQLELLCATKPIPKTPHGRMLQTANTLNQGASSSEPSVPAFHLVSKMNSSTRSPVCFYSSRFINQSSHSSDQNNLEKYLNKSEMRHSRGELLYSTSHIMVKISRTLRSSTPALNGVEIWGRVSSGVSHSIRQFIERKYLNFLTPTMPTPDNISVELAGTKNISCDESKLCEEKKNVPLQSNDSESESIEIPEEFLDPITCEVMTIPMCLPCGKNIDKSSLDRFSDSEAMHGRRPRDPFTGVEFSATVKPIPNVDLKARIDAFLMFNSSAKSIANIPRTLKKGESSRLGKRKRNDNGSVVNVSTLVGLRETKSAIDTNKNQNTSSGISTLNSSNDNAKVDEQDSLTNNPVKRNVVSTTSVNYVVTKSNVSGSSGSVDCSEKNIQKSHDAMLKDSLNSDLFSVLAASSFSTRHRESSLMRADYINDRDSIRVCMSCGTTLRPADREIMYATPCSHLVCRKCLLSMPSLLDDQRITCKQCGRTFDKRDVVRSH